MMRITDGDDLWIAFRDFLEDWTYMPEGRAERITQRPPVGRPHDHRWAALLAAAVKTLRERDGVTIPSWTTDQPYLLQDPWYLYEGANHLRSWLRLTTPSPFANRNIWSGDKLLRRT